MSPKQMKIGSKSADQVVFKGFGTDAMDGDFSDYGLTVYLNGDNAIRCILHMYDRNTDIEYV